MTDQSPSRPMVQDQRSQGTHPGYMPGFGNDFETEALPDALPQGMNSRRNATTASMASSSPAPPSPRRATRTSAPGATASAPRSSIRGGFRRSICPTGRSAPHVVEDVISLGQYRWDPVPTRTSPLTWLTGMRTMTTAGDVNTQVGMASHIYLVTASMEDEYFYSADSELLIVPQEGQAQVLHRARHHRPGAAGDRDHPARAGLPGRGRRRPGARLRLRELRPEVRAARAWADRRQLHGQPRDFKTPVAAFEDREVPSTVTVKWCGQFHETEIGHSARSTSSPGTATTRR
jgi:homogentisate 1,2-dioxygenase